MKRWINVRDTVYLHIWFHAHYSQNSNSTSIFSSCFYFDIIAALLFLFRLSVYVYKVKLQSFKAATKRGAVGNRTPHADLNVKFRYVHVWSMWNQFKVSNYVPFIIRQSEIFSWRDLELLCVMRVLIFTSYVRSPSRQMQHRISLLKHIKAEREREHRKGKPDYSAELQTMHA
jgi:hypothetical protein